jgi:ubiquinone/menaquinone biosynthesis C-methylase UbiE
MAKTMKIILPSKKLMNKILAADPNQEIFSLNRYYSPLYKFFYLKRFKIVLKLIDNEKFENMLDVGFGSGIFLPTLAKNAQNLYAIDIHQHIGLVEEMLKNTGARIRLKQASALNLPFENDSFDCITCLSVLEFIEDTDKAVSEMVRVAKKGAKIIIGAPSVNKLTDFCYKIAGKSGQNQKHYSNQNKIITSVKKFWKVEKIIKFPSFTPLNYSMFFVLSARKR